ncbi:MAG TPA: LON peptidase substrate-binding domain-containing protein [Acidimicrobiales bacterium]|nr:LON peptidase substrate-binding domain-containing protein [Acidimicrobiales bacterium]
MSDGDELVAIPLPMFPLGTVALPGSVVPLHIFEPRYRQLAHDLQRGDGRFGIVLIERGHEVGGGEVRTTFGTRMRMAEASEFDDGRWAILAVGEERIRVVTWLPDDPYPLALVETPRPGPAPSEEANAIAEAAVRRALGLAARLGYEVPSLDDVLVADPQTRQWQLAGVTPAGPVDRQRILAEDDAERRADVIAALALDAAEMFALELGRREDG